MHLEPGEGRSFLGIVCSYVSTLEPKEQIFFIMKMASINRLLCQRGLNYADCIPYRGVTHSRGYLQGKYMLTLV